ncbi:hypothetical protein [Synechococcus sp. CC9902]|uniref:hypothetical protein n=1 Tax=Synechococcus sp. (strain CC9902) TaxID=316279 RepID=UPI000310556D|nr:hypothetical protein [Synechococcus sp. CC9902]
MSKSLLSLSLPALSPAIFFCLPRGEAAMTHENGMVSHKHPSQTPPQKLRPKVTLSAKAHS